VHTLSAELVDTRQRAEFFEKDNVGLYAEIADLRLTAKRVSELDSCQKRLSAAETQATKLEQSLADKVQEMNQMSACLDEAHKENAEFQELTRHLQHEVKRLQERSMLNLIKLYKFIKLQMLLTLGN